MGDTLYHPRNGPELFAAAQSTLAASNDASRDGDDATAQLLATQAVAYALLSQVAATIDTTGPDVPPAWYRAVHPS
jgi:hypothetical protein